MLSAHDHREEGQGEDALLEGVPEPGLDDMVGGSANRGELEGVLVVAVTKVEVGHVLVRCGGGIERREVTATDAVDEIGASDVDVVERRRDGSDGDSRGSDESGRLIENGAEKTQHSLEFVVVDEGRQSVGGGGCALRGEIRLLLGLGVLLFAARDSHALDDFTEMNVENTTRAGTGGEAGADERGEGKAELVLELVQQRLATSVDGLGQGGQSGGALLVLRRELRGDEALQDELEILRGAELHLGANGGEIDLGERVRDVVELAELRHDGFEVSVAEFRNSDDVAGIVAADFKRLVSARSFFAGEDETNVLGQTGRDPFEIVILQGRRR